MIQSADMKDGPVINPNRLTDPVDQEMAVAAFKRARALFHTNAMQEVVIESEVNPGEDVSTDVEILEYIRSNCLTIYHASCTCAMGKRDNPMAVVDSQAKVIGVDGLRVVDVSALPFLPPGQPQVSLRRRY
jgi:choline dehydrogenase